jgi:hypothetical protein
LRREALPARRTHSNHTTVDRSSSGPDRPATPSADDGDRLPAGPAVPYSAPMSGSSAQGEIHDMAKLEEMELVDNLEMAAAAAPQRRLTAEEIDQALGL